MIMSAINDIVNACNSGTSSMTDGFTDIFTSASDLQMLSTYASSEMGDSASNFLFLSANNALILPVSILIIALFVVVGVQIQQLLHKKRLLKEIGEREKILRDRVDELKSYVQKLEGAKHSAESSLAAKSNFLAETSHEIRTPMNGIMGMASLLQDTKLNETQRIYVDAIEKSSENLLAILNDLLDYSKIEAGKMSFEKKIIDLELLINEVRTIFVKQAEEKHIQIENRITDERVKFFMGDILRIRQVLINLVSNAVKYTANGKITIQVDLDDLRPGKTGKEKIAHLQFRVIDEGEGIPLSKQEKIFKAFEQGDVSSSRLHGGIGLGLSISKRLVELMGGEMRLQSEPGKGSTFCFCLDVEIPRKAYLMDQLQKEKPGKTSDDSHLAEDIPIHILIAEDNEFNMLMLEKTLEKFGFNNVLKAENGLEVMELLHENPVDLILMDIQMPEMDGVQTTLAIQEELGEGRPKIIALTAHASDTSKAFYLEQGMDGFLSMPFKADDLRALLLQYGRQLQLEKGSDTRS